MSRPGVYAVLLAVVVVLSGLYGLRRDGIFACQASGYRADSYLAYCQATHYGDYDHGAFWFDLEPDASASATNAEALFVGNSRMQLALSTPETEQWFAAHGATYFLLGFSHNVNVVFETPLLRKLRPRARVYVVNVDWFFRQSGSQPVRTVFEDSTARGRYETKRDWQPIHRYACQHAPFLCMDEYVIHRSRLTGAWHVSGGEIRPKPVSYDGAEESRQTLDAYAAAARQFVDSLPVGRNCIILTQVPFVGTDTATASAIAASLGMDLIAPRLDGLTTFDQSHLDGQSAERWSTAFFEAAGSRIEACLHSRGAAARTAAKVTSDDAGR